MILSKKKCLNHLNICKISGIIRTSIVGILTIITEIEEWSASDTAALGFEANQL
jgi:hypothetical protein